MLQEKTISQTVLGLNVMYEISSSHQLIYHTPQPPTLSPQILHTASSPPPLHYMQSLHNPLRYHNIPKPVITLYDTLGYSKQQLLSPRSTNCKFPLRAWWLALERGRASFRFALFRPFISLSLQDRQLILAAHQQDVVSLFYGIDVDSVLSLALSLFQRTPAYYMYITATRDHILGLAIF